MGLDRGVLCCRHGPGTWKWFKLLDVTHLGPGPRKLWLGGQFPVPRERFQAVLCFLPQYFLFPLFPCPLGQRYYIAKIRVRALKSRLKKKDDFHVVIAA